MTTFAYCLTDIAMAYRIEIALPAEWNSSFETNLDPDGTEISHFSAFLPDDRNRTDTAEIDIYLGAMPSDSDAQEQAMLNYADMVGFDDDDPEDEDPLTEWPFAGKKAYGFECLCEDDSPMRVMFCEIRQGQLAIVSIIGKDDETLAETVSTVDKLLRIRKS